MLFACFFTCSKLRSRSSRIPMERLALFRETCQPSPAMLQSVDYNVFNVRIKDGGERKMSSLNEQLAKDWWAEGDTPVRNDSHVTYFVDGRIAMFSMCLHFLRAR